MRFRAAFIVVGLLVVAGCGGGSDNKSAATSGATSSTTSGAGDLAGAFDSKACASALSGMGKVTAALPGAMSGQSGDLQDSVKQFEAFVKAAPKEIRSDLQTLATAYSKAAEVLKDYDPSSGKAPTQEQMQKLTTIGESFDSTEIKDASERVTTWFKEKCGKS